MPDDLERFLSRARDGWHHVAAARDTGVTMSRVFCLAATHASGYHDWFDGSYLFRVAAVLASRQNSGSWQWSAKHGGCTGVGDGGEHIPRAFVHCPADECTAADAVEAAR